MAAIWAGIDAGKTHRLCVVIDDTGKRLLSRRVANDESELLRLLGDVLDLGDEAVRGIDLADGGAAMVIAILLNHGQQLLYTPSGWSTGPARATGATARPTPRTRWSSPTRPVSGATADPCGPAAS